MASARSPLACLAEALAHYSARIAVIDGERSFTYQQFAERCQRLAGLLSELGIKPGDRVAYLSWNSHHLLEGYFGISLSGAVFLPLQPRLAADELTEICVDAQPALLIFQDAFAAQAEHLSKVCPSLRWLLNVSDSGSFGQSLEGMMRSAEPQRLEWASEKEDTVAQVLYTSGATGKPKAVQHSHRALYEHASLLARVLREQIGEPGSAVDLYTMSLAHAAGWGHPHASTQLGFTHVLLSRFIPSETCVAIEKHAANYIGLVPTTARMLVDYLRGPVAHNLSSLRVVEIGGASVTNELLRSTRAALQCPTVAGYGMTEAGPLIAMTQPSSLSPRYYPVRPVQVRVVDTWGTDIPQDDETVGEIAVESPALMLGSQTLLTGDLGSWHIDGSFTISDRSKDIIISGGQNISSVQLEQLMEQHPSVEECAVIAAPHPHWGERAMAVIVPSQGATLTAEQMRAFLATRVARFKLPERFHFVDGPLPRTATGKLRKSQLRDIYQTTLPTSRDN